MEAGSLLMVYLWKTDSITLPHSIGQNQVMGPARVTERDL